MIWIVAFAARVVVSADVSFPRGCSDIGSDDVQPREAMRGVPRRSFGACQSRSPAAHIEGVSTAGGRIVWPRCRLAFVEQGCRAPHRPDPPRAIDSADEHLVEIPLISRSPAAAARAFGETLAEFLAPTADGLIGDNNASLGQQEFNVSRAEAEDVVQPDGMRDDLGRKAMAVARVGRRLHAASRAGLQAACHTRLP